MQRKPSLCALLVAISLTGFVCAVEMAAANETKGTKPDQQPTRDKTTTKSKLEGQKKGEGDAAFKELNKNAPGGAEPALDGEGHRKSGGTGSGSGTGTTGASGGSASGEGGSGGK